MTDAELIQTMSSLGMDDLSYKALPLLPLVQVAWADGEIQGSERQLILDLAESRWNVGEEGRLLLDNWLLYPPSAAYMHRGQLALAAIAAKANPDMPMDVEVLDDVVTLARDVAKAAGGLFGIGAVSRDESKAIAEIAKALDISDGTPWERQTEPVLAGSFADKKRKRVTITCSTATLDVVARGGVLESELMPGFKAPVDRKGLTIGKAPDADLRVELDQSVSDLHCRLFERNRKFYVRDLNSTNGTFVDGEQVRERRLLGGEEIRPGDNTTFTFKLLRKIPKQML